MNNYYSSELKPHAIELTQFHYPNTIQLGDVNNWKEWDIDWKSINLLLSGSPCKDLSGAGKRKGIYGESGFNIKELTPILEDLESETRIIKRPTINSSAYFLTFKTKSQ